MKTFLIVLLATFSLTILSQDCNNPLLERFGLAALDEPQSGSDLPYCSGLQAAETCCSADTVAGFQDRANALVDKLNNYGAAKDLYLAQLRNKFYDRFRDIYSDLSSDSSDDHISSIRRVNNTLADELQSDINNFTQINNNARGINRDFKTAFNDYQVARNNCYTAALQVQTSAWCLACDPNYATEGVADDGTVTFSDGICQTLNDACWPLFNQSARFNPLIRAREAYWRLIAVQRYLSDYSDTNNVTPFIVSRDPYNPLSTQQATTVPDQWPNAGNDGQCSDLWSGDELLAELLAITDSNGSSEARLLQDVLAGDEGAWGPDLEGTGLDLDLLLNPGDVYDSSDSDYNGRRVRRWRSTDTSDH